MFRKSKIIWTSARFEKVEDKDLQYPNGEGRHIFVLNESETFISCAEGYSEPANSLQLQPPVHFRFGLDNALYFLSSLGDACM